MDSNQLKKRAIKDGTRPGIKRFWIGLNVVQDMMMLWTLWGTEPEFDDKANKFVTDLLEMAKSASGQKRASTEESDDMKACGKLMNDLKSVGTDSDYHKQSFAMIQRMGDTVTILLWLGMWIREYIIKTDDRMVKGRYLGAKRDTYLPKFLYDDENEEGVEGTMSEIEDIAPTTALIERNYEKENVKVPARIISLAVLLFKNQKRVE